MDLDATLKKLHDRVVSIERLVDPKVVSRLLDLAASSDTPVDVVDLKKHVDELGEALASMQHTMEQLPETISKSLDDALAPFKAQMDAVSKLADPSVIEMLDWLARNREAIDVLLQLGTDTGEPAQTASADPAAPAPASDQTAPAGS